MLGIMLKDWYETFCLRKNMIGNLIGYVFLIFVMFVFPSQQNYLLISGIIFPFFSAIIIQASLEQDEISKYDEIMLTYPLTKKEVILARLGSSIVYILFQYVVVALLSLIYVYQFNFIGIKEAYMIWLASFIFSFITLGINMIFFFWLGNKKGTILYIFMIFVYCTIYFISRVFNDWMLLFELEPYILYLLGAAVAIACIVLGYVISLKVYTHKVMK